MLGMASGVILTTRGAIFVLRLGVRGGFGLFGFFVF